MSELSSNDLAASMLMLNDDCLMHIMDFLSMTDCKSFGSTCSRIFGVYLENPHIVFKRVQVDELKRLPVRKRLPFFQLCGHYIKEIKGHFNYQNFPELFENLGAYCVKFESIEFFEQEFSASDIRKIFSKMNNLRNLLFYDSNITNDCLLELEHLTIRKLNLRGNCDLSRLNMNLLPASIESLTFYGCGTLQTELLPESLKALPQLKELNLMYVPQLSNLFQRLVSGNCCNCLETFFYCIEFQDGDYEFIAMLPSLKKLIIESPDIILRPELFTMLVKHKSEQLEHLDVSNYQNEEIWKISQLSGLRSLSLNSSCEIGDPEMKAMCKLKQLEAIEVTNCSNVSNNAVLQLILSCPKLQELWLFGCAKLTGKLLIDIIDELQQQTGQRPLPIKLNLKRIKITEPILQILGVTSKQIIDVRLY